MEELDNPADLLDLQAVDLEIDRLLHRRQSLAELEDYRHAHLRAQDLAARLGEVEETLREVELDLDKAEGELELLEQKTDIEERRLFAGGLSARETEHLRLEVESLRRRIGEMENRVLERMDRREELDKDRSDLAAQLEGARGQERRLEAAIAAEWRTIDAEIARKEARKADIVLLIPPDLLELYEELRRTKEGVAVGRLAEGICGGCHLKLSAAEQMEVLRGRPPRCLHCRRILVAQ